MFYSGTITVLKPVHTSCHLVYAPETHSPFATTWYPIELVNISTFEKFSAYICKNALSIPVYSDGIPAGRYMFYAMILQN